MRKIISIIFILATLAMAGRFYELEKYSKKFLPSPKSSIIENGSYYILKSINVPIGGTDATAIIDTISIENMTWTRARIYMKFVVEDLKKGDDGVYNKNQSYYISIGFYDSDKNFLVGKTFFSHQGVTLMGVSAGLQATKMSIDYWGSGAWCLRGVADIFVHQTFMYNIGEYGVSVIVKPIKYCTVKLIHLGAG